MEGSMKKLSDYKDNEAIELWGELLDPMSRILGDPNVAGAIRRGKPALIIASEIMKTHKDEAKEIMLRIDPTPIDGINFVTRLTSIVMDFINNESLKDFFRSAGQEKTDAESIGSVTDNIEGAEV
jgi:hypothetical protein